MTTYKEAKEIINNMYTFWRNNVLNSGRAIESLELSVIALEKQIPKAIEYDNTIKYHCPSCKSHVNLEDVYCKYCGQSIYYDINKE